MAFTTYDEFRTAIKDAMRAKLTDSPFVSSYSIAGRSLASYSYEELSKLLKDSYEFEALESSGDRNQITSFGRHRRF